MRTCARAWRLPVHRIWRISRCVRLRSSIPHRSHAPDLHSEMQTRYDELPYPGLAFAETHPDRLATMATLFGMTPAPVEGCRVLELGCGDGGNLIPMAFTLPKSCFTGLDLAGTAIARGRSLLGALDLSNIRLLHLDLLDVSIDFGEFDYIIAHGL